MGLVFLFGMALGFVPGVIITLFTLAGMRGDKNTITIWKCVLICLICVILVGISVSSGSKMLALMVRGPEKYMISTDEIDFSAYQSQDSSKSTGGILPKTVMKVRRSGGFFWVTVEARLQEHGMSRLPVSYCDDDPPICGRTQGP
jgi:hypothetical protein